MISLLPQISGAAPTCAGGSRSRTLALAVAARTERTVVMKNWRRIGVRVDFLPRVGGGVAAPTLGQGATRWVSAVAICRLKPSSPNAHSPLVAARSASRKAASRGGPNSGPGMPGGRPPSGQARDRANGRWPGGRRPPKRPRRSSTMGNARMRDHSGAHGVELDVRAASEKISLAVDRCRPVASLPQRADSTVGGIDVSDVAPAEGLHRAWQAVFVARCHQQTNRCGWLVCLEVRARFLSISAALGRLFLWENLT